MVKLPYQKDTEEDEDIEEHFDQTIECKLIAKGQGLEPACSDKLFVCISGYVANKLES